MGKSAPKIEAIVLRFRDKGIEVTDTIQEHTKFLCSKDSFVWWGWWAKDHENTPLKFFKAVKEKVEQDICKVFLLNTKTKRVYVARCVKFLFSEDQGDGNRTGLCSPDPDKTPSYYNDQELKLWLKLTAISEVDSTQLIGSKYSFHKDDPSLFRQPKKYNHRFAAFAECKVTDVEELITQQRTIWFLQKQKETDNEVNLSEWAPTPLNFAKHPTFAGADSYKILLLSDLHFTDSVDAKSRKRHNFYIGNDTSDTELTLLQSLEYVVSKPSIGGFSKVAGIIIAGDFVFSPDDENEFNLASKFIESLLEKARIKPQQLAIVPGNHDIAYGEYHHTDPNVFQYADATLTKNYKDFYEDIYNVEPHQYLCGCRKIELPNGLHVDIICVNSCLLTQQPNILVQGFVGEKQWKTIANELNIQPNRKTYNYRILVMHHHLMSTSIYSEIPERCKNYNVLLDAGSVSHKVRTSDVKLVVHGHGHESGSDRSAPRRESNGVSQCSYDVISLGSSGSSDLPEGDKNTFGVLDFSEHLKVKFSRYVLPNSQREISMLERAGDIQPIESFDLPIYE